MRTVLPRNFGSVRAISANTLAINCKSAVACSFRPYASLPRSKVESRISEGTRTLVAQGTGDCRTSLLIQTVSNRPLNIYREATGLREVCNEPLCPGFIQVMSEMGD